MTGTKGDKKGRREKSATQKLKDQQIVQMALQGKTREEIATELGVNHKVVSRAMNSDEVKAKVKEIDGKLASFIETAIETVGREVGSNYIAARDLLKNFGSMKQQIDLSHSFPKPTVIERLDGSQVVLGTKEDGEDTK